MKGSEMTVVEAMRLRDKLHNEVSIHAMEFAISTGLGVEVTVSVDHNDGEVTSECHVAVRMPYKSVLATDNLKQ